MFPYTVSSLEPGRYVIVDLASGTTATESALNAVISAANLGNGSGIYAGKTGTTLYFKSLKAGSNISLTETSTGITVSVTGSTTAFATQAEQEAGTSNTVAITPGRQHFHPSAAKCFAVVTVSAGVPTLQTSYNISSITDTAQGRVTINLATNFSSTHWACVASVERASTSLAVANIANVEIRNATKTISSVQLECWDDTATTHVAEDPTSYSMVGYGDV
jgi:hypothetical protein